ARIRLSQASRTLAPRQRQDRQSRRARPQAHGRHVRARQGRDAHPCVSRPRTPTYGHCRCDADVAGPACTMTASPYVLLDDSLTPGGRSLLYTEPERIVAAYTPDEVEAALKEVEAGLAARPHTTGLLSPETGSFPHT